jgi:hypothetical protein
MSKSTIYKKITSKQKNREELFLKQALSIKYYLECEYSNRIYDLRKLYNDCNGRKAGKCS